MKIRYLIAALVCALTFCSAATSASAADYCVGSSPSCTGSPLADFPFSRQGVLDAVAAANGHVGTDSVHIAEGTIDITTPMQPTTPAGETVDIVGAGVGKTIFNGTVASSPQVYWDFGDSTSSASGFSIDVNGAVNGGSGMFLGRGTVEDAAITEAQATNTGYLGASLLNGATLQDVSVENVSAGSNGVYATTGAATLTNVTIDGVGGTGLFLSPSSAVTFNISRVKISNFGNGLYATAGNLNLDDSLIDLGAAAGNVGFYAVNGSAPAAPIVARINRVTIVGSGNNQKGMQFGGAAPSGHFDGEFKDMLIYSSGTGFVSQFCSQGASSGNTSWGYNDVVATNGSITPASNCSPGWNTKIDLAVDVPEFRDFANGDYRLKWNSPLIDVGTSTGALDLAGKPRVLDGDGDATAKADIGAYEYQRSAPVVTLAAAKESLGLLEATTFTGAASDADEESLTYSWKVDGSAAVGTGNTLSIGFIAAGQHMVTFTAADESGLDSSATVAVNVQSAKVNPPPTSNTPTVKLASKPKKSFKRGKSGFGVAKKGAASFTIVFTDTAQAKFTLQSIGKKKKLKSVKGQTLFRVNSATTKFGFGGKFGGKRLKSGKYRVTITPLDASGAAGKPLTVDIKLK